MKKITIKVTSRVSEGFNLFKGQEVEAYCANKVIRWDRREVIETALTLPKTLSFKVFPNHENLEIEVFQVLNERRVSKTFVADIVAKDMWVDNIESGIFLIEGFILEVEDFFKYIRDNGKKVTTIYTAGGRG